MVQINFALKEINCKLVYYGPGRSGKTTNLEQVYQKAPEDSKGELVSINTETDRTLYFDFLPLNLGKVAGMSTKFSLYTVPGQVYYNATRKLVLQGCDGVVFVADSSPHMMDENIESLDNMLENLKQNGLDPDTLPIILQLNKRDVDGALEASHMIEILKKGADWTVIEACAFKGEGVFPTLKALAGMVISKLNDQQGAAKQSAPVAPKPTAPPVQATQTPPPPVVEPKTAMQPVESSPKTEEKVAPPPASVAPPKPVESVAQSKPVETPPPVVKEESKSDLIAARLAKMRADKGSPSEQSAEAQPEVAKPRKLQQKGFMGFLKRLFGKG